jgi:group I intron endonuclease
MWDSDGVINRCDKRFRAFSHFKQLNCGKLTTLAEGGFVMGNYIVYMHVNKANGKRYIGITSMKPEDRWKSGEGYRKNEHFYRSIKKYGWDGFEHKIVAKDLTEEQASILERSLIEKYQSNHCKFGYNKTNGGEIGKEYSKEVREKMSLHSYWKGKHGANYGKKFSEEIRRKIGEKSKGRKFSAEAIEKIRASSLGRKLSEDARRKISEANKGRNKGVCLSEETRAKISASGRGKKRSLETRLRMSAGQTGHTVSESTRYKLSVANKGKPGPNLGKPMSEETKIKLSHSRKGKCVGKDNPLSRKVINLNTKLIFDSVNEATKYCKINFAGISRACNKKQKTAGKHAETGEEMYWMYYEDYLKSVNQKSA